MLNITKVKYLAAGAWNTVFGYVSGIVLYMLLKERLPLPVILLISNTLSLTIAFLSYKIFVFQTSGNWIREYIKCILVYGFGAMYSIGLIWILMEGIGWSIWFAQACAMGSVVVISYFAHKKFTFKTK